MLELAGNEPRETGVDHGSRTDWLAARGRLYTLETTTDLGSANWQGLAGATDMVGDNAMRFITNSVSGTGFYRLRTRLQRP